MKQANHLALATLFRLAWRNLWRNYRRTLIMAGAITLGVWAMIFMSALLRGMVDDMVSRGIERLPGNAQIQNTAFFDDPSIENTLPEPSGELLNALNQAPVSHWFTRLNVSAMITSEYDTKGVQLIGFDPLKEPANHTDFQLIEGEDITDANTNGIIIGKKLADKLETRLGKRIVIMSQDPDNEIAETGIRITGIFTAQMAALEESMVYMSLPQVQSLLRTPNRVTEINVFTDGYRNNGHLKTHLENHLSDDQQILLWTELDTYLGTTLTFMDGFVFIWIIVVFLAMSFGLANTLIMAVFERTREIGLMLALGMQSNAILLQILFETMLLLILGLTAGTLLASATVVWLSSGIDISVISEATSDLGISNMLYPALYLNDVFMANMTVLILGLLTGILPAMRASKLNPVTALNTTD